MAWLQLVVNDVHRIARIDRLPAFGAIVVILRIVSLFKIGRLSAEPAIDFCVHGGSVCRCVQAELLEECGFLEKWVLDNSPAPTPAVILRGTKSKRPMSELADIS